MKAYPFKIPKPVHESLTVQTDKGLSFYNKLHLHAEMQLSHIIAGDGKLICADSIHYFKAGDIFVIGSKSPHVFQSNINSGPSHMVSLFFDKGIFQDLILHFPELSPINGFIKKTEKGIRIHSKEKEIVHLLDGIQCKKGLEKFILFLRLIQVIEKAKISYLSNFKYSKDMSGREGKRMQEIFDFVMHNFQKEITLEKIAQKAHMTPNSFCRFFKQRTNKTFFEFLIALRVEHACQLLITHTDTPVSEICFDSGFNSISHFNRKFKKLKGVAPLEYATHIRSV